MNREEWKIARCMGAPARRPTVARTPVKVSVIATNQDAFADCDEDFFNLILVLVPTEGGGWALHSPVLDCWIVCIDPGDGRFLDEIGKFLAGEPGGGGVKINGVAYRSTNGRVTVGVICHIETGTLLPVEV